MPWPLFPWPVAAACCTEKHRALETMPCAATYLLASRVICSPKSSAPENTARTKVRGRGRETVCGCRHVQILCVCVCVCVYVCVCARGTFHLERAAVHERGVARLQEGDRVRANKSCGRCDEATEDGGQKCELHLSTLMGRCQIGFVSRRRPHLQEPPGL